MSIVEKLTEGIVNRDMKKEGAALLSKWESTGLLEGLQNEQEKNNMARLLENQARELLREASSMGASSGGGSVEGFAAVAFPIVRRVFAGLIANDLVSVQPMSLPSGLIFFLDFTFSAEIAGTDTMPRFGNIAEKSLYGTNQVGKDIQEGVDLIDSRKGDFSGPRGMTGEAYGSPQEGNTVIAANTVTDAATKSAFTLDGAVSDANKKLIQYDPDLLAVTDSSLFVAVIDVEEDKLTNADLDNLSAFSFEEIASGAVNAGNSIVTMMNGITGVSGADVTKLAQVRRLTSLASAAEAATTEKAVRFVIVSDATGGPALAANTTNANLGALALGSETVPKIQFPARDTATSSASSGGAIVDYTMLLEDNVNIPEIDIKVDSIAITAQTKKLKAKWTPELGQDLNAYHNLDAEVELTSILSEQIALEIDREILADLVNGGTAATYYWSRSPGLFVNRETGLEIGANKAAPDFTGTVSEWYETLIETINDVSAQIHRKTLRGGANFVVCSPEVANILEFTAGFRANVTADADKGDIGAVNVGSLSRKFDVIVDPYFPRQIVLVGRRGSSFLESGYVYAPYVPLQTTPTIFGPEDFVPRKGVMTRYAKKMVRPDMYGLVVVRGLLGEEYS